MAERSILNAAEAANEAIIVAANMAIFAKLAFMCTVSFRLPHIIRYHADIFKWPANIKDPK